MVDAKTLISIDDDLVEPNNYYDVQLYTSIGDHLPILSFKLRDRNGLYWKKLNFSIGSVVRLYYVSAASTDGTTETSNYWKTTKFIISTMYNGFEFGNNDNMGGYIQINCEQAWSFYEDYTPHAYNCMKMGDLIKTICKSAKSEADLSVDDENFVSSSDSGSIRYKVGISDLDFITDKLLPYTMVDNSNSFFYMTKTGDVHLSGFNTLYSAQEKLIIHPDMETVEGATDGLDALKQEKNIDKHLSYLTLDSQIAPASNAIKKLRQKLYFYDTANEATDIGFQTPTLSLGSDGSKLKKTYVPIKNTIVNDEVITDAFYMGNHTFEEQVALSRNTLISTNNLTSITVALGSFTPEVEVGDTIYLWVPPKKQIENETEEDNELTDKTKNHWMNGKWLIKTETIITTDDGILATRYNLIRPALEVDVDNTSLSDYKTFFKVK